jgi:hypothetical protein
LIKQQSRLSATDCRIAANLQLKMKSLSKIQSLTIPMAILIAIKSIAMIIKNIDMMLFSKSQNQKVKVNLRKVN